MDLNKITLKALSSYELSLFVPVDIDLLYSLDTNGRKVEKLLSSIKEYVNKPLFDKLPSYLFVESLDGLVQKPSTLQPVFEHEALELYRANKWLLGRNYSQCLFKYSWDRYSDREKPRDFGFITSLLLNRYVKEKGLD